MRTVGLDIASCTGMALVGEDEDRGRTVHLPRQKGYQRLQLVAQEVQRTVQAWSADLIVIEAYAYCRNIRSFVTLVELGTVVRAGLYAAGRAWVEVPPTVLKKWTTGRGNADKVAMARAVQDRWAYRSQSMDIVDAYALAQMGQLGVAELVRIPGVFLVHPADTC